MDAMVWVVLGALAVPAILALWALERAIRRARRGRQFKVDSRGQFRAGQPKIPG